MNTKTVGQGLLAMAQGHTPRIASARDAIRHAHAGLGVSLEQGASPRPGTTTEDEPAKPLREELEEQRKRALTGLENTDDPEEFKTRRAKLRAIEQQIAAFDAGVAHAKTPTR